MDAEDGIRIGRRELGPGRPCYVMAEIGINHNGDRELGIRTIEAAAAAGADAVKFQNYRTEDFLSDRTLTHRYVSGGREHEEPQYDLFKRCEMSRDDLVAYKAAADALGLDFVSTPTNADGVADLVAIGAAAVKNGSDYLGHLPLIRAMAASRLPTILSTGMATLTEIDEAARAFREAGGQNLVLLHCVSVYPAPVAELNLRKIPALAAAFGCPVGFSDHSVGVGGAIVSATLGACMIEKHFTLDRNLPGPDHAMSSDPAEMAALVTAVREAAAALGTATLGPAAGEAYSRSNYRLSCVARSDLSQGHVLGEADIAFRRPGEGIRPAAAEALIGRRLLAPVSRGHLFAWTDFA